MFLIYHFTFDFACNERKLRVVKHAMRNNIFLMTDTLNFENVYAILLCASLSPSFVFMVMIAKALKFELHFSNESFCCHVSLEKAYSHDAVSDKCHEIALC